MKDDILRNIISGTYNRYIPDDVELVERNGYVFFGHWKYRFDPVTLLVLGAVGTGISVAGTLQQGRQQEKIAKRQAEIDIANAKKVREATVEEARIKREEGQRLLARQKGVAAAGGIRLNVGIPLLIETETQADISQDIGFILERGGEEAEFLRSRAGITRASGKAARRKSKFSALTQGLLGAATIGFQAREAGLFKGTPSIAPAGTFRETTGIGQVRFARRFLRS